MLLRPGTRARGGRRGRLPAADVDLHAARSGALYDSRAGTCDGPGRRGDPVFTYPLCARRRRRGLLEPLRRQLCRDPSESEAAILNGDRRRTALAGYVSTTACSDLSQPRTSTLNFDRAGQLVPNLAVAAVSRGDGDPGSLCVRQKANGHLVSTRSVYFPAGSGYTRSRLRGCSTPGRISQDDGVDAGAVARRASSSARSPSRGGSGARLPALDAAVVNVTVTGPTSPDGSPCTRAARPRPRRR